MSAIPNLPRDTETVDRQENASGAFAGAFFANQGLDCASGHVPTVQELLLAEIAQNANTATLPLEDVLAVLKGRKDASELKA